MQFTEPKSSLTAERLYRVTLLGTGNGTAPTVEVGQGITVAWIATGRLTITWRDNPGTFVGMTSATFRDATPSVVKGFSASSGNYPATAATFTLEVDLWSSTFAAQDLATTSRVSLSFAFNELKIP